MTDVSRIRNFAIIAHVDHGKSTLADRFLELTGSVEVGKHEAQLLDRNPISRERGITIKLAPVRMVFGKYIFNLIDTPGHVDFSYEVDRTLACVEGALLLVDATQGIQAQTIANAYKALEKNLVIVPVVNKIDLDNADVTGTKKQIIDFLGVNESEIYLVSAKTGEGTKELLEAVIDKLPFPSHSSNGYVNEAPIGDKLRQTSPKDDTGLASDRRISINGDRALIFDSYYDCHRGVIAFIRIFGGNFKKGSVVKLYQADKRFEIREVGFFNPNLIAKEFLANGEIGYAITNLKDIRDVRVGDTLTDEKNMTAPLSGYKKVRSLVFASIFPTDNQDFLDLKKSLEKLYLNDSSLQFRSIYSKALGPGFRVGFLGLLHADIVRERLEREFNLDLVLTPPQVEFQFENNQFFEPYVKLMIITPQLFLGAVMRLIEDYRGKFVDMDNRSQISLIYEMPMSEMISDFYDRLKSVSSGYASLDWEFIEYRKVEADKMKILLNGTEIEEFSEVVVKERIMEKSRQLIERLRKIVPRQQYEVKIQAQYKGKILASERIAPFRKNVLVKNSKVIGAGDFGRKRKLLEKQKEGKKKMKMIGRVEIPKEAFMKLFRKT